MDNTDLFGTLHGQYQEIVPPTLVPETKSSISQYVFHGCHCSGGDYRWYLTHDDMCILPTSSMGGHSVGLTELHQVRWVSEPDVRRQFYAGPGTVQPPPLKDMPARRSFSHGILCDPNCLSKVDRMFLPRLDHCWSDDVCPICYTSWDDHPFQHSVFEVEDHQQHLKSVISVPDSIPTDSTSSSPCSQLVIPETPSGSD